MPAMTAIALDRLLEPSRGRTNSKASLPIRSPALYVTPDPLPVPVASSLPSSPSPYIANRKGRLAKVEEKEKEKEKEMEVEVEVEGAVVVVGDGGDGDGDGSETPRREGDLDGDVDDFFDPSSSIASCSSSSGGAAGFWNRTMSAVSESEFYDADQDFSDSVSQSSPSFSKDFEAELRLLRLNLREEIEKRKNAEKAVIDMQNWWRRMAECLSCSGFLLPVDHHSENVQLESDPAEFFQEIVVSKLVSEAVEKDLVRAETEAVVDEVIDSKNHEISRLQDRVQYYEAVNREMSQRNQEVIELARQKRLRRKTRQKWIWSCIGLSVTVGASLLVYSYLTDSAMESLTTSEDVSSDTAESDMHS